VVTTRTPVTLPPFALEIVPGLPTPTRIIVMAASGYTRPCLQIGGRNLRLGFRCRLHERRVHLLRDRIADARLLPRLRHLTFQVRIHGLGGSSFSHCVLPQHEKKTRHPRAAPRRAQGKQTRARQQMPGQVRRKPTPPMGFRSHRIDRVAEWRLRRHDVRTGPRR
jgi:hypothetical protein